MLLFISTSEIMIVLLIAFILFGSKRIPELARGLGKGLNEFRKTTDNIKKEITRDTPEVVEKVNDIKKMTTTIVKEINDTKDIIEKIKG